MDVEFSSHSIAFGATNARCGIEQKRNISLSRVNALGRNGRKNTKTSGALISKSTKARGQRQTPHKLLTTRKNGNKVYLPLLLQGVRHRPGRRHEAKAEKKPLPRSPAAKGGAYATATRGRMGRQPKGRIDP